MVNIGQFVKAILLKIRLRVTKNLEFGILSKTNRFLKNFENT